MYDVGGTLLSGIKIMYVNSLACIEWKGWKRVFRNLKLDKVISWPLGSSTCIVYGCSDERGESGDEKGGSKVSGVGERVEIAWSLVCRWLGFVWWIEGRPEGDGGASCWGLYEERFESQCRKEQVMGLGVEKGLEWEICVDGPQLEQPRVQIFGECFGWIRLGLFGLGNQSYIMIPSLF